MKTNSQYSCCGTKHARVLRWQVLQSRSLQPFVARVDTRRVLAPHLVMKECPSQLAQESWVSLGFLPHPVHITKRRPDTNNRSAAGRVVRRSVVNDADSFLVELRQEHQNGENLHCSSRDRPNGAGGHTSSPSTTLYGVRSVTVAIVIRSWK